MKADLQTGRRLFALILSAFLIRVGLIFLFKSGGYDLKIYHYFGSLVLAGQNPYRAPATGLIDPRYADMSPVNLGLFASILWIWNSGQALRLFLAVVDAILLFTVAKSTWISSQSRRRFLLFYAFNPLLLLAWVAAAEDKNIVLGLTVILLGAVFRRRVVRASAICGILAAYKFIGIVYAPPLIVHLRRTKANPLPPVLVLVGILVLAHSVYFPDSLLMYQHRLARSQFPAPLHASPMAVLAWLGLYTPMTAAVFLGITLLFLYWAHLSNRLRTEETIVLTGFAMGVLSPDAGIDRLLLVSLPFLFFLAPTPKRMWLIWILSLSASAALFWELGPPAWTPGAHAVAKFADPVFGQYGSRQHVLFMNLVPWTLLALFLHDRRHTPIADSLVLP